MPLDDVLDTATAKIVRFLLEHPVLDYSKTEIADGAGVSRSTLYRRWDALEELGIVTATRRFQNTQLYTLDEDATVVELLGQLMQEIEERSIADRVEA